MFLLPRDRIGLSASGYTTPLSGTPLGYKGNPVLSPGTVVGVGMCGFRTAEPALPDSDKVKPPGSPVPDLKSNQITAVELTADQDQDARAR
jgi:hypothetical protein